MDLALNNLQRFNLCRLFNPLQRNKETNNLPLTWKRLWKIEHKNLQRKFPALVNGRNVVFLYNNTSATISKNHAGKTLELGWSVLLHHTIFIKPGITWFRSAFVLWQNVVNDKNFLKIRWNMFVENLFSVETNWFLLERNQQATCYIGDSK